MSIPPRKLSRKNIDRKLRELPIRKKIKEQKKKIKKSKPFQYEKIISDPEKDTDFEIFAYCSKNYQDAFEFVMPSWTRCKSVTKITVYTDWDFKYDHDKVEIIHMFSPSSDWITGTGHRLDIIKHFSYTNKGTNKRVLFLDIDCYLVKDVEEVFTKDFDIAISRLHIAELYANQTATAGLWFARLTPGYFKFIEEWFTLAKAYKMKKIGIQKYHISYVQYSFTDVAKAVTDGFKVYPIDENVYNSEHTISARWLEKIKKFKPKILHYKGRRFRDPNIVNKTLRAVGER